MVACKPEAVIDLTVWQLELPFQRLFYCFSISSTPKYCPTSKIIPDVPDINMAASKPEVLIDRTVRQLELPFERLSVECGAPVNPDENKNINGRSGPKSKMAVVNRKC